MSDSKFVRLKLTGGAPDKPIIHGSTLSLIDADTGKIIRATNVHLFIQNNTVMAEVTCYLTEIDIETKAEKIVVCAKCQREQNPGPELISGEKITTDSE